MDKIIIECDVREGINISLYSITQGNKKSDQMDWGEMMMLLASLTMPVPRPALHWMKEMEPQYAVTVIAESPKENP